MFAPLASSNCADVHTMQLTHLFFHNSYPKSLTTPSLLSAGVVGATLGPRLARSSYPFSDAVLALGVYCVSVFTSIVLYRLSPFHPLAKHPGPALAKVTTLWGMYITWAGHRHLVLHRLHRELGPVIRIGTELSQPFFRP